MTVVTRASARKKVNKCTPGAEISPIFKKLPEVLVDIVLQYTYDSNHREPFVWMFHKKTFSFRMQINPGHIATLNNAICQKQMYPPNYNVFADRTHPLIRVVTIITNVKINATETQASRSMRVEGFRVSYNLAVKHTAYKEFPIQWPSYTKLVKNWGEVEEKIRIKRMKVKYQQQMKKYKEYMKQEAELNKKGVVPDKKKKRILVPTKDIPAERICNLRATSFVGNPLIKKRLSVVSSSSL
jgi:hypothetical protein